MRPGSPNACSPPLSLAPEALCRVSSPVSRRLVRVPSQFQITSPPRASSVLGISVSATAAPKTRRTVCRHIGTSIRECRTGRSVWEWPWQAASVHHPPGAATTGGSMTGGVTPHVPMPSLTSLGSFSPGVGGVNCSCSLCRLRSVSPLGGRRLQLSPQSTISGSAKAGSALHSSSGAGVASSTGLPYATRTRSASASRFAQQQHFRAKRDIQVPSRLWSDTGSPRLLTMASVSHVVSPRTSAGGTGGVCGASISSVPPAGCSQSVPVASGCSLGGVSVTAVGVRTGSILWCP